jgi:hypothetical protein
MRFTQTSVQAIKPNGKKQLIADDDATGLKLYVGPTGVKVWYYCRRDANSTLRTHFTNKKQKFGLRAQPALVICLQEKPPVCGHSGGIIYRTVQNENQGERGADYCLPCSTPKENRLLRDILDGLPIGLQDDGLYISLQARYRMQERLRLLAKSTSLHLRFPCGPPFGSPFYMTWLFLLSA